ncbi:MAG: class I SAM-dependent methyltransferase [Nitrospinota bacterium]
MPDTVVSPTGNLISPAPKGRNISFICPLCTSRKTSLFVQDEFRTYQKCNPCALIFVSPSQFLPKHEEKERYDLHRNAPESYEYRKFLSPIFQAVLKTLAPKSSGLDFGSGPGPTLSLMFEEHGHRMALYDIFYAKDPRVLTKKYDFITASEVVEHLHKPGLEFLRLWGCLKEGGRLALMTRRPPDEEQAFSDWFYKNDPTHVCFFSQKTFTWLSKMLNARVQFTERDVVVFQKETASQKE